MIRVLYISVDPKTGVETTRLSNQKVTKEGIESFVGGTLVDNMSGDRSVRIAITQRSPKQYQRIVKDLRNFDTKENVFVVFGAWNTSRYGKNKKQSDIIWRTFKFSQNYGNAIIFQGFTVPDIKVHYS